MGIERATTRWHLQRLAYESEAASLEAKLGEMRKNAQTFESKERAEFEKQLAHILIQVEYFRSVP